MQYFDTHPDILEWSSEEVIVQYLKPTTGRIHRYFPDFVIKRRIADNSTKVLMVEIKHSSEAREPKPKKNTRRAINEVRTWAVNQAKWNAARAFCADRGWDFIVLTERELGKSY